MNGHQVSVVLVTFLPYHIKNGWDQTLTTKNCYFLCREKINQKFLEKDLRVNRKKNDMRQADFFLHKIIIKNKNSSHYGDSGLRTMSVL